MQGIQQGQRFLEAFLEGGGVLWKALRRQKHACAFLNGGGGLNPGERHSRVTRGDGTVTLCALRAATVLLSCTQLLRRFWSSRNKGGWGRTSCDGPGVTAPLRTNIVPLTPVWNPPPSVTSPFKKAPNLPFLWRNSQYLSRGREPPLLPILAFFLADFWPLCSQV